jgi:hypothetical protein
MLFRMVEILFGLFVENSNGELRRTTTIPSSPQNNNYSHCSETTDLRLDTQLLFLFWEHQLFCYSWSIQTYQKEWKEKKENHLMWRGIKEIKPNFFCVANHVGFNLSNRYILPNNILNPLNLKYSLKWS